MMGRLLTVLASSGLSLPYTDAFTADGAFASPWLNSAWSKTGGAGVAAVTLGPELVVNGGFDSDMAWTKGAGWTIGGGVASLTAGSVSILSQDILTAGRWYTAGYSITAISGWLFAMFGNNGVSYGTKNATGIYTTVARGYNTKAGFSPADGATSATIDNVSYKQIALASTLNLLNAARANLSASAKVTAATGTQAGVALCWDSATSPANGVIGYFDRTNAHVKLDKCVAGTWTSVIDVAVSYSAGAVVKVVQTGSTTWRLYYGGTQRGTDVTISDAGIVGNTLHGLFSTYANSFDDFALEVS